MTLNSAHARDIAYVVHQQTNLNTYAETGGPVMVKGDGVYVFDDTGKRYLEAMAAMWCASLGFSEKRLADAAYKQMQELPYYHIFNKTHVPGIDLAEKLIEIAPRTPGAEPLTKVMFQSSGSEANDTAIKMIWYYFNAIGKPAKKKIIGRDRGKHDRNGEPVRPTAHARRFRPSVGRVSPHRQSALLPLPHRRRERRGLRDADGSGTGSPDRGRRSGHHRGVLC
jgi:adenosylmethionine-8-amino-7-oxononanoate aminotransferase